MSKLWLAIAFTLIISACAKDSESSTPIADQFIAGKGAFVDANCGGVLDDTCEAIYWATFTEALDLAYALEMSEPRKFCDLWPEFCVSEKTTERYFQNWPVDFTPVPAPPNLKPFVYHDSQNN